MMGMYFKSLRRKFGVLTLLIACVFLSTWITDELFYVRFEPGQQVARNYADFHMTVTPFALLSAYLLLSKPRPKTFEPIESPTKTEP